MVKPKQRRRAPRDGEVEIDPDALRTVLHEAERRDIDHGLDKKLVGLWTSRSKQGHPPRVKRERLGRFVECCNRSAPGLTSLEQLVLGGTCPPQSDTLRAALRACYGVITPCGIASPAEVALLDICVERELGPLSDRSRQAIELGPLIARARAHHRATLILGSTGMGKSFLLQTLVVSVLAQPTADASARQDPELALLVSLANYDGGSLSELVVRQLKNKVGESLSLRQMDRVRKYLEAPSDTRLFLALDDLDRAADQHLSELYRELNRLQKASVRLVLASRLTPPELHGLPTESYVLQPLPLEKIKELATRFATHLQRPLVDWRGTDKQTLALLSTPLFVMAYITSGRPSPPFRMNLLEQMVDISEQWRSMAKTAFGDIDSRELRMVVEHVALGPISRGQPQDLTFSELENEVIKAVRGQHFIGDTISINYKAKCILKALFKSGLLERPEKTAVRWSHHVIPEYLAADAVFRREVYSGGITKFVDFLCAHFAEPMWRETLLFALARHQHDCKLVDGAVAHLLPKAQAGAWEPGTFLISMLRDGVRSTCVNAVELVQAFWRCCEVQKTWPRIESFLPDLWCALRLLSYESAEAVNSWIRCNLGSLPPKKLERFVPIFVAEEDLPPELAKRAQDEPAVSELLWRLWPARRFITQLTLTARPVSSDINVELVALRCAVCLKETWPDGAARFVLLLLQRTLWTARAMMEGLRDPDLPVCIEVREGCGHRAQRIHLVPAIIPVSDALVVEARQLSRVDVEVLENLLTELGIMLELTCMSLSPEDPKHGLVKTFMWSAKQHYPRLLTQHILQDNAPSAVNEARIRELMTLAAEITRAHPDYEAERRKLSNPDKRAITLIDSIAQLFEQSPITDLRTGELIPCTLNTYGAHLLDIVAGALTEEARRRLKYDRRPDGQLGQSRRRNRLEAFVLPAVRAQNRWLLIFLDILVRDVTRTPEVDALVLALGLAQYQTTWAWPVSEYWAGLIGPAAREPKHWLPRFMWCLCRAAIQPGEAEAYLKKALHALGLAVGSVSDVFIGGLRAFMVRPITPQDVGPRRRGSDRS